MHQLTTAKKQHSYRPTHLSSLGFIMKKPKNQKEPYLPLPHHREMFYQVTAERDCTSSRKHAVQSFAEVSVFSFCGLHPYRGHQRHPARRQARFPKMQYCTKQRKFPSLDSFQAVYTQITNTKGVSFLSVGILLTLSVTAERSWNFFFSAESRQCEKVKKCCPSKGQIRTVRKKKFSGCRIAQLESSVFSISCLPQGGTKCVTICPPPCWLMLMWPC